ncbi:hypothetical protein, partial [Rhodopseudomonas palustris]|uniref:hypothetical protein n=1 Tax=Rhodopseudomonas palustris TaxID=1076 RepID=UPI001A9D3041
KTKTRKDFAVHVSLSSSSLVKQPEIRKSHSLLKERTCPSATKRSINRQLSAVASLNEVRSSEGANYSRDPRTVGAPDRRAARRCVYSRPLLGPQAENEGFAKNPVPGGKRTTRLPWTTRATNRLMVTEPRNMGIFRKVSPSPLPKWCRRGLWKTPD